MTQSCLRALLLLLAAGCRDSTVSPRGPVTVKPESVRLFVTQTARLQAVDEQSVVWRSTTPIVATVSSDGLVTAIGPGATDVWAIRGRDSASARVEVVAFCGGTATVSPANATITPGDSVRAEARDRCAQFASGFAWTSADTTIAVVAVRETGVGGSAAMVTAKRPGQVVITARLIDDPVVDGNFALTVRAP